MAIEKGIVFLVGVVILIIIATGFGSTIINSTDSRDCNLPTENRSACGLENVSATGKTMYATVEFLYPILIVLAMIGAFGLGKKFLG